VALTATLFGTEISALAVPLTAAIWLGASPFEMGMLAAAGQAPWLLCSLPLGVWIDRVARLRPLLIAVDLGRAALLGMVPLAAFLGLLRFELLYVVVFLVGVLSVAFDVAHYAYVPAVVPAFRLTEANGRIQVSYAAAEAAGPGLAGLLVQVITAPFALVASALSLVGSALLLMSGSRPEPARSTTVRRHGVRAEALAGLRALLGHPLLRPIVVTAGLTSLCLEAVRALYVLYAARDLALDPTVLGLIFATGGAAAIPGGLIAGRVARRLGVGSVVTGGWVIAGASLLLIPLAQGSAAIAVLLASQALGGFAGAVANVNQWTLRQTVTPERLQARVTASHRFLVYGAYPIGALLGGVVATGIGLRAALLIFALGATLAPLWLLGSPVWPLRELPLDADPERSSTFGRS
jgi:MFS family permease